MRHNLANNPVTVATVAGLQPHGENVFLINKGISVLASLLVVVVLMVIFVPLVVSCSS